MCPSDQTKITASLTSESAVLVVVDIQGKLAQLMHDKQSLFDNTEILIQAARILQIPILWVQQCPDALGPTVPQIARHLEGIEPINKASFSCCGSPRFDQALADLGRPHVLLCGIETHVCIYQTARDLLQRGYCVTVIEDAVSSRTTANKRTAIRRLAAEGAIISSTEMVLFEILRAAEHPKFKQIAKLVK